MRPRAGRTRLAQLVAVAMTAAVLVPAIFAGTKYEVLHNFGASGDGTIPYGPPIVDRKGNLYGVTTTGGTGQCSDYGCGTVFKLAYGASHRWVEDVLHNFAGGSGGAFPWGGLGLDGSGNLYGTMSGYGSAAAGGVFELGPAPHSWSYNILYSDVAGPGLLIDKVGDLYGEMGSGQSKYYGAIGELSPGSSGWNYTELYSFCTKLSCADGYNLAAPPIRDGKGNLYGATVDGGKGPPFCGNGDGGCGVIFKMTPNQDGTWAYHVLHRFAAFATDGQSPNGGLAMDASGNLYGVTVYGGAYNRGIVFKLTFVGGHWKESTLYDFPNCADGCYPAGTPAFDKAGNLYATASGGLGDCGGFTCGVVFKLSPQQNGTWKYSVVYKLHGTDGNFLPYGVIVDSKGNIFGTTSAGGTYNSGVAFEITP
jgi:uncharacterized repeat protein (TIGR03803 family)